MSRIPSTVAQIVYLRADGHCEACGWPMHHKRAFHHRLPRSGGGKDTVPNLMLVHGDFDRNCHNSTPYSIHQNPARSYRLGHLVHRGTDPDSVVVVVAADLQYLRE